MRRTRGMSAGNRRPAPERGLELPAVRNQAVEVLRGSNGHGHGATADADRLRTRIQLPSTACSTTPVATPTRK